MVSHSQMLDDDFYVIFYPNSEQYESFIINHVLGQHHQSLYSSTFTKNCICIKMRIDENNIIKMGVYGDGSSFSSFIKFSLILNVFILSPVIVPVSGLKCHSCIYVAGVLGDENCKYGEGLSKSGLTPCDNTASALNAREILATRLFSPEVNFRLMCLKSVIKSGDVDIAIRGCYGQPLRKVPVGKSSCESPDPGFWQELRKGALSKSQKQLDFSRGKLDVCVCYDREGCNTASLPKISLFLLCLSFMLIFNFNYN